MFDRIKQIFLIFSVISNSWAKMSMVVKIFMEYIHIYWTMQYMLTDRNVR